MFTSGTLGCLLLGVASLVFLFGSEWVVFFCYSLICCVYLCDLLCKRISSPPCVGSAVWALLIKRAKNLFQG